jgi:hypothetical protein
MEAAAQTGQLKDINDISIEHDLTRIGLRSNGAKATG